MYSKKPIRLIEIVISITVISLLISLSIPIYTKLSESAKEAICAHNLKQLGQGLFQYSYDNNMFLPHEDDGEKDPPYNAVWFKKVLPYLGDYGEKYRQEKGYLELSNSFDEIVYSYKFNSRLEDYKGDKSYRSPPFRNVNTIKSPNETVLLFDGRTDKTPFMYRPYGIWTSIHTRHNQKANILFFDGSVKSIQNEIDHENAWVNEGGLIWDPEGKIKKLKRQK